jgi:hypothetical protein
VGYNLAPWIKTLNERTFWCSIQFAIIYLGKLFKRDTKTHGWGYLLIFKFVA